MGHLLASVLGTQVFLHPYLLDLGDIGKGKDINL